MKKEYMMPAMQVCEIQVSKMVAVSMYDEDADPDNIVLGRERVEWDDWLEDE